MLQPELINSQAYCSFLVMLERSMDGKEEFKTGQQLILLLLKFSLKETSDIVVNVVNAL